MAFTWFSQGLTRFNQPFPSFSIPFSCSKNPRCPVRGPRHAQAGGFPGHGEDVVPSTSHLRRGLLRGTGMAILWPGQTKRGDTEEEQESMLDAELQEVLFIYIINII